MAKKQKQSTAIVYDTQEQAFVEVTTPGDAQIPVVPEHHMRLVEAVNAGHSMVRGPEGHAVPGPLVPQVLPPGLFITVAIGQRTMVARSLRYASSAEAAALHDGYRAWAQRHHAAVDAATPAVIAGDVTVEQALESLPQWSAEHAA